MTPVIRYCLVELAFVQTYLIRSAVLPLKSGRKSGSLREGRKYA